MGRQLQLLFTELDDKAFIDVMRDKFGALVMRSSFLVPEERILSRSDGLTPQLFMLILVPQDLVTGVRTKYYAEPKLYFVDQIASEVMEFSRAEVFNQYMRSGRVWYEPKLWSEHNKAYEFKSERFLKWAESICRWIKREYVYIKNEGYVGPDALRRSEAGEFRIRR